MNRLQRELEELCTCQHKMKDHIENYQNCTKCDCGEYEVVFDE